MNDTSTPTTQKRPAGPRLQHVVAHLNENHTTSSPAYDDMIVFGQEIDALRHIVGKTNWFYTSVAHGQSVAEALKAAR